MLQTLPLTTARPARLRPGTQLLRRWLGRFGVTDSASETPSDETSNETPSDETSNETPSVKLQTPKLQIPIYPQRLGALQLVAAGPVSMLCEGAQGVLMPSLGTSQFLEWQGNGSCWLEPGSSLHREQRRVVLLVKQLLGRRIPTKGQQSTRVGSCDLCCQGPRICGFYHGGKNLFALHYLLRPTACEW